MYETTTHADAAAWTPLDFPGVSVRVLHQDAATGALTVQTRLEPGATIPAHYHGRADETVYVLEGDFIEAGVAHGPGAVFFGRAGVPHGPHRSAGGCVVLTHFTAPPDFHPV